MNIFPLLFSFPGIFSSMSYILLVMVPFVVPVAYPDFLFPEFPQLGSGRGLGKQNQKWGSLASRQVTYLFWLVWTASEQCKSAEVGERAQEVWGGELGGRFGGYVVWNRIWGSWTVQLAENNFKCIKDHTEALIPWIWIHLNSTAQKITSEQDPDSTGFTTNSLIINGTKWNC